MLSKKFNTNNLIILWEGSSSKGHRKKLFKGYKSKRSENKTPEEILEKVQFNKEANELFDKCLLLGFEGYCLDGYEADDLIAYYCETHPQEEIVIVTNDEDMYQCLKHDNVTIYNIDKKIRKDKAWFEETYTITPDLWYLVKAQAGCKSDSVPGIIGVGEKTAIKYITGNASEKISNKIKLHDDEVNKNIKLVKLPFEKIYSEKFSFSKNQTQLNKDAFIDLCLELDFRYFLENISDFNILFNGEK